MMHERRKFSSPTGDYTESFDISKEDFESGKRETKTRTKSFDLKEVVKQQSEKSLTVAESTSTQAKSRAEKAAAAIFYAVSSLAVIFVNKEVLSAYGFPSGNFLATCQFTVTCLVLSLLNATGQIKLPPLSWQIVLRVSPLSLFFLLNVATGLGGTQRVNLPMFTVLRRFSILFSMILERIILGYRETWKVKLSVFLMILGAVIAGLYDLAFDLKGYIFILLNDIFTAANGVTVKYVLEGQDITKMALLFYNSLFGLVVMLFYLSLERTELQDCLSFLGWGSSPSSSPSLLPPGAEDIDDARPGEGPTLVFWMLFCLANIMGSVLSYSIFVCTSVNSALTTAVVGCLKNVITTYLGMVVGGGGYLFSWVNFWGLNISIVGSLIYSYEKMVK